MNANTYWKLDWRRAKITRFGFMLATTMRWSSPRTKIMQNGCEEDGLGHRSFGYDWEMLRLAHSLIGSLHCLDKR